jgi:hypothetical protein
MKEHNEISTQFCLYDLQQQQKKLFFVIKYMSHSNSLESKFKFLVVLWFKFIWLQYSSSKTQFLIGHNRLPEISQDTNYCDNVILLYIIGVKFWVEKEWV